MDGGPLDGAEGVSGLAVNGDEGVDSGEAVVMGIMPYWGLGDDLDETTGCMEAEVVDSSVCPELILEGCVECTE